MKITKTSNALTSMVASLEGFSPVIYRCPTGYKTIGYGHVVQPVDMAFKHILGFTKVPHEIEITQEMAIEILKHDIEVFEKGVAKVCPNLNQQEFDACVSLAFNIGLQAFNNSTLVKLIDQGFLEEAAEQFTRWSFGRDHSGIPVRISGLYKRRELERLVFLSGIKTPKLNRSVVTKEQATVIELSYAAYAKMLFSELGIKIELEA